MAQTMLGSAIAKILLVALLFVFLPLSSGCSPRPSPGDPWCMFNNISADDLDAVAAVAHADSLRFSEAYRYSLHSARRSARVGAASAFWSSTFDSAHIQCSACSETRLSASGPNGTPISIVALAPRNHRALVMLAGAPRSTASGIDVANLLRAGIAVAFAVHPGTSDINPVELDKDSLISAAREVLIQRLATPRSLILVAHETQNWSATKAVAARPELFSAFVAQTAPTATHEHELNQLPVPDTSFEVPTLVVNSAQRHQPSVIPLLDWIKHLRCDGLSHQKAAYLLCDEDGTAGESSLGCRDLVQAFVLAHAFAS